jgi:thiamine pyrophosphokinase
MSSDHRWAETGASQGLLVIGGAAPAPGELLLCARGMHLVIAADSGYDHCRAAGLVPDLVVGDMDSLSDPDALERLPAARVMRFPRDKDETDTEIGMRLLLEKGCTRITIAGGGGGRIDHLLGIAGLFERERPPVRWVTDREDMHLVEGELFLEGCRGATVSVFPLGAGAGDMRSEGLFWPLSGLEFARGSAGISNRAVADRIRITVGNGRLLVIKSYPKD